MNRGRPFPSPLQLPAGGPALRVSGIRTACRNAALLLVVDLLEALFQVLRVFLLQRRVFRGAVNLARLVLAFVELLAGPFVVDVGGVGAIEDVGQSLRWNEIG